MRIDLPESEQNNPVAHLASHYAPDIVNAALNFSKVTYLSSSLSLREFEAARARTAEINGCKVCKSYRAARDLPLYLAALGANAEKSVASHGPVPDEAFYQSVSGWRESPLYSARERIAIEYAEGLGLDPQRIAADDAFWRRARAEFSDAEIVDLSYCIACWMGLGRVTHALGIDTVCAIGPVDQ